MKRLRYILLTITMLILMTATVYAEPSEDIPTGLLDLKGDVPEGLNGTIEFTVYNKTIDKEIGISLSYYNGYEAMVFAEFGDYEMSSAKFMNTNRQTLDCTISIEPFNVGNENPNGDWTYKVVVKVTPNSEDVNETVKTELEDAISDYLTGGNSSTNETSDNSANVDGNTLTIPADNQYFPNMTLTEIKKWYIDEVNKFIASGGTTKYGRTHTLEEYQNSLKLWAGWCYDKKENQSYTAYQAGVEEYNVEATQDFYQVQKKIYDFIKEYQEEYNTYLNFENWDKVDELEITTEAPSTSDVEENTSAVEEKETTTEAPSTSGDNNDGADDKEEKSFFDTLKSAWLTILILIVVIIGGIVWKVKYNKSEE